MNPGRVKGPFRATLKLLLLDLRSPRNVMGRACDPRRCQAYLGSQKTTSTETFLGLNYYELLNIPETASTKEIQAAFRRLSKAYHPDKDGDSVNPLIFREIVDARECLIDSARRREYDRNLSGFPKTSGSSNSSTHDSSSSSEDSCDEASSQQRYSNDSGSSTKTTSIGYIRSRSPLTFTIAILLFLLGGIVKYLGRQPHMFFVEQTSGYLTIFGEYAIIAFFLFPRKMIRRVRSFLNRDS